MSTSSSDELGQFALAARIGQGGMAEVYKAVRKSGDLSRTVVIKRLLPEHAGDPQLVELFRSEARLLALLNHSNIVQFLEFGLADGAPYMVMEYLEGHDVAEILDRCSRMKSRLPIEAVIAIGLEMCQGLAWAHDLVTEDGSRHQIIHRDVTPANVMLCRDGGVKLLDFGVAKITRELSRERTTVKGKFGYMAPEQLRGEPIDRRVDVFSVGVVLHEMLTCRRLFRARNAHDGLAEIGEKASRPPSHDNPEVPRELDDIVLRALSPDPASRYASASELSEALEGLTIRPYSRRRLALLIDQLFPIASAASRRRDDDTIMDLKPRAVEVFSSRVGLPILEATPGLIRGASTTRRPPLFNARALTIAVSAVTMTLAVGLVHGLRARSEAPEPMVTALAKPAPTPPTLPSPPTMVGEEPAPPPVVRTVVGPRARRPHRAPVAPPPSTDDDPPPSEPSSPPPEESDD